MGIDKVELKVNVINQLKLFRQSTFKDVLCFLDEDIQNAQRAKATELRVTTAKNEGILIIENNGKVLEDPQSLFSIAESGWDDDTKSNENPFGIGFFSNISVSNLIEVITGDKHIIFDVNKMINSGDCSLEVLKSEEYYDGFKLILNNFDYNDIAAYSIGERIERLGKYIHELDVYYNGCLQNKKDLTQSDINYTFSTTIEDDDIKGWIAIATNYAFTKEISIYYKGRFVKNIDYPYLKGDIHITDRLLNLTAPDRKDIIIDKKYSEFKELLDLYVKELAYDSFMNGEDKYIEEYCSAINYYIDKKELIKNAKFSVFKGSDKVNYLKEIALVRKANKDIKTFKDYQCHLDKESLPKEEDKVEEVVVSETMHFNVPEAKGTSYRDGYSSYSGGYSTRPEIKKEELEVKDGESILNNSESVFWMTFDEIDKFEYKFNIIKHYGLKLIVARNKVEQSILESLNEQMRVFHVSELHKEVKFESTISNTELSTKENRAFMILDMISKMFDFEHNIFSIGDVMSTKIISLGKTDIIDTIIDDNVVIIRDSKTKKVYVDRSVIDLSNLSENLDDDISLQDVQFILRNLKDITDSIGLLKGTANDTIRDIIIEAITNIN